MTSADFVEITNNGEQVMIGEWRFARSLIHSGRYFACDVILVA